MASFKQYSFQPSEPKKPKPTHKTLKVHDGTGIKEVKDTTKHALARARWGNNWYNQDKKKRVKAQADFRAQNNNESAVFGGNEGKSNEGKSPERNVYRVVITQTKEEELQYFEELLDSGELLDEKVNSTNWTTDDAEKLIRTGAPGYWTPRLRENDWDDEFPLAILSGWSEKDGAHVLATGDNFKRLTDPNDVIEQLFATFRTGFGPYVENNWGNIWSFDINNNVFMIDVKLFNQLSSSSRQKLCGPIGNNSLTFPNIWIYSIK